MQNINEISLLLKRYFSANRCEKVKTLVKEPLMGLPLYFKKRVDLGPNLPLDPVADEWHCHETRAIDLSYFNLGTVTRVEDHVLDDGLVHTQHEHVVHQIYAATSYTNESTHRSVFARTGERIGKLSYNRGKVRVPSRRHLAVSKVVSGVTANLYGNVVAAEGNYFHWFVDALARLFLIERFHSLDKIDHVLVPPLKYDFQWDSLAALGFERSQIIELRPLECLQFDCLLASSAPRGKGSAISPGWAIDKYNKTLLEKAASTPSVAGKKVYISRSDAPNRMFLNEKEVREFLENRGFDVIELTPLTLFQKIAVFRDANLIVSQTGAGLTNLMFCHSKVKVLELVDKRFVYPSYASLAVHGGGKHYAHFFSSDRAFVRTNAMVVKSSLTIDDLEKSLSTVESM